MQVTASARLLTNDKGALNGAIELKVEWIPSSEQENILLRHLLSEGAHDSAVAETANFGPKLISKVTLQSDSLAPAQAEMARYAAWKRADGNWQGQHVSFDVFKALNAEADAYATPVAPTVDGSQHLTQPVSSDPIVGARGENGGWVNTHQRPDGTTYEAKEIPVPTE